MRKNILVTLMLLAFASPFATFAQSMMGGGMMGSWDYVPPGNRAAMTMDQAVDIVQRYLSSWGNPDLSLAEVMEFSNHFYAEVTEVSTKVHAFEILINKYTAQIFPEPGPNMLWNLKYGYMVGGMMGNFSQPNPDQKMTISSDKARELAQKYLDLRQPGTKVEDGSDAFYGYYSIHVLKDGKTFGMLGVNGYTGEVWYHVWHGTFVGMKEIGPSAMKM
jgi:hypothetical protein